MSQGAARGSTVHPQVAAWLSGPLWRHCKDTSSVEFSWQLNAHCPVPGSYALHAIATVKAPGRSERRFSMFRFTRYDPAQLAQCLLGLGWEEIGALTYAGDHALRLYRKFDGSIDAGALSAQTQPVLSDDPQGPASGAPEEARVRRVRR